VYRHTATTAPPPNRYQPTRPHLHRLRPRTPHLRRRTARRRHKLLAHVAGQPSHADMISVDTWTHTTVMRATTVHIARSVMLGRIPSSGTSTRLAPVRRRKTATVRRALQGDRQTPIEWVSVVVVLWSHGRHLSRYVPWPCSFADIIIISFFFFAIAFGFCLDHAFTLSMDRDARSYLLPSVFLVAVALSPLIISALLICSLLFLHVDSLVFCTTLYPYL
jgi:hypothetical protein